MPAAPFLYYVNSRPKAVSNELWKEFYASEHLPDVVDSGCAERGALYQAIDAPLTAPIGNDRNILALYQTPFQELLKSENLKKVRIKSELFAKEGAANDVFKNGDWLIRNYELVQEFDPFQNGQSPPPQLLTVEMHPIDVDDFEKWYREEHLNMLSKLPGYRRSLRYRLGPKSVMFPGDFDPQYLAIHEVDDLAIAFGGPEAEAANSTSWALQHIQHSKVVVARGWKLLVSRGFW